MYFLCFTLYLNYTTFCWQIFCVLHHFIYLIPFVRTWLIVFCTANVAQLTDLSTEKNKTKQKTLVQIRKGLNVQPGNNQSTAPQNVYYLEKTMNQK